MDKNKFAQGTFHYRLQELCDHKGYSQQTVANGIHMTKQGYNRIANGTMPSLEALIALSKFLEVTPNYLLGVSEYKTENEIIASNQRLDALSAMMASNEEVAGLVHKLICVLEAMDKQGLSVMGGMIYKIMDALYFLEQTLWRPNEQQNPSISKVIQPEFMSNFIYIYVDKVQDLQQGKQDLRDSCDDLFGIFSGWLYQDCTRNADDAEKAAIMEIAKLTLDDADFKKYII